MGSILKFVFSSWAERSGKRCPISNGMHPEINNHIKEIVHQITSYDPFAYSLRVPELDSLYQIPDSGIFFRHSNLLHFFIKNYGEENVVTEDEVVDDGSIYFYPIEWEQSGFRALVEDINFKLNGKEYQYRFSNIIPLKILTLLQNNKIKILICNIIDPGGPLHLIHMFEKEMEAMMVSPSNIVFLQGNTPSTKEHPVGYVNSSQITGMISLVQASYTYSCWPSVSDLGYKNEAVKEADLDPNHLRKYKFLCFNRTLNRPHRIALMYLALKNNLLDQGIFSFITGMHEDPAFALSQLIDGDDFSEITEQIRNMVPYEVDTHCLSAEEKTRFQTVTNNKKELYAESYLNIVSETIFNNDMSPFISEKTWRPMLNLQLFIHVGNFNSLGLIKELGFKTFHPFINEEYDSVLDSRKRFALVSEEIIRIGNLPINKLHDLYYSVTDVLLHNQKHIQTFIDYNPIQELEKYGNQ